MALAKAPDEQGPRRTESYVEGLARRATQDSGIYDVRMKDSTDHTVVSIIPRIEGERKEKHPYILFQQGPLFGKIILLSNGSITLGRSAQADITIDDEGISRKHLMLTHKEGRTFAKDLESTNGTYVNGQRIREKELKHEDKIQISSSTLIKYIYADKLDESTQAELYNMGHRDPLTNVFNRRHFLERIKGEFSFAVRNKNPLSLLMIDLDFFKKVNDTWGHPAGDFVLMKLSRLTQSIIREEDILARYGGEEFVLLLKGTDKKGAYILAERLRILVEEHDFIFDSQKIPVTISIGAATLKDKNFTDHEEMIKAADRLLYDSKQHGRNCVTC